VLLGPARAVVVAVLRAGSALTGNTVVSVEALALADILLSSSTSSFVVLRPSDRSLYSTTKNCYIPQTYRREATRKKNIPRETEPEAQKSLCSYMPFGFVNVREVSD